MLVIVYNKKTGKGVEIDAIDAREYVETGGWTMEKPIEEPDEKPKPKAYKKVNPAEVDEEVIAKTVKK